MDRPQPALLQANLLLVGATVFGLLLAVVLGAVLGESEFTPIALIFAALGVVLFVLGLYRYVWQMALFFLFFAFLYRPASFGFGALELSSALGVGIVALFIWQKRAKTLSPVLDGRSFKFLKNALFLWLLYIALHMVYNLTSPYQPSEFALNNSIKSYFAVSAPLVLLFYFARSPGGVVVRKDFFWTIARLCLIGLLLNLAVRIYELVTGGTVFIPLIKATENIYALRSLGPLAMTIGIVGITASGGRKTLPRYVTYWLLLTIGSVGSALSAGRITLLIGFVSVCAVLVLRRKVVALSMVVLVGILGAAVANLSSDWINTRANPYLQRSVQWVLIDKGNAAADIEGSSNWRRELFSRAIEEWRSDPRIFWTGRATYGFGVADETSILLAGGYEALIRTALRRGTTHNLISDLLVVYGVAGLILYLTVYAAITRFLWKLYRARNLSPAAADLTLVTLVGSLSWFVYSVIGGQFYFTEYVWFLIVLIGAFHAGIGLEEPGRRMPSRRMAPRPWQAATQPPLRLAQEPERPIRS